MFSSRRIKEQTSHTLYSPISLFLEIMEFILLIYSIASLCPLLKSMFILQFTRLWFLDLETWIEGSRWMMKKCLLCEWIKHHLSPFYYLFKCKHKYPVWGILDHRHLIYFLSILACINYKWRLWTCFFLADVTLFNLSILLFNLLMLFLKFLIAILWWFRRESISS